MRNLLWHLCLLGVLISSCLATNSGFDNLESDLFDEANIIESAEDDAVGFSGHYNIESDCTCSMAKSTDFWRDVLTGADAADLRAVIAEAVVDELYERRLIQERATSRDTESNEGDVLFSEGTMNTNAPVSNDIMSYSYDIEPVSAESELEFVEENHVGEGLNKENNDDSSDENVDQRSDENNDLSSDENESLDGRSGEEGEFMDNLSLFDEDDAVLSDQEPSFQKVHESTFTPEGLWLDARLLQIEAELLRMTERLNSVSGEVSTIPKATMDGDVSTQETPGSTNPTDDVAPSEEISMSLNGAHSSVKSSGEHVVETDEQLCDGNLSHGVVLSDASLVEEMCSVMETRLSEIDRVSRNVTEDLQSLTLRLLGFEGAISAVAYAHEDLNTWRDVVTKELESLAEDFVARRAEEEGVSESVSNFENRIATLEMHLENAFANTDDDDDDNAEEGFGHSTGSNDMLPERLSALEERIAMAEEELAVVSEDVSRKGFGEEGMSGCKAKEREMEDLSHRVGDLEGWVLENHEGGGTVDEEFVSAVQNALMQVSDATQQLQESHDDVAAWIEVYGSYVEDLARGSDADDFSSNGSPDDEYSDANETSNDTKGGCDSTPRDSNQIGGCSCDDNGVMKVRGLEVVDSAGRVSVRLFSEDDLSGARRGISIFDSLGRTRGSLTATDSADDVRLELFDRDSLPRATLYAGSAAAVETTSSSSSLPKKPVGGLLLLDAHKSSVLALTSTKGGGGWIDMSSSGSKRLSVSISESGGTPRMELSDASGSRRIGLGVAKNGDPLVRLYDKQQHAAVTLGSTMEQSGISLQDGDGVERIGLWALTSSTSGGGGGGGLWELKDHLGKARVEASVTSRSAHVRVLGKTNEPAVTMAAVDAKSSPSSRAELVLHDRWGKNKLEMTCQDKDAARLRYYDVGEKKWYDSEGVADGSMIRWQYAKPKATAPTVTELPSVVRKEIGSKSEREKNKNSQEPRKKLPS